MKNESYETQLASSLIQLLEFDEQTKPEGAVIFLNGPWGCGKTYFWKHNLRTGIKNNKCLYVSLFGVQSVSDLKEKLIAAILGGSNKSEGHLAKSWQLISKLIPSIGASLKNFAGIEIKVDLLELIPQQYIVCFDDLERLPSSASIEEILGFINYLSEHKGYRCLVILNEAEIKEPHRSDFYKLREKLSLRTFELPFDLESRFESFLKSKAQVFGLEILEQEAHRLKLAITSIETNNLRTVRFILDCYLQLRSKLNRELPEEVAKFLVAMADHESKGHREEWKFYAFNPMEVYFREHTRKRENNNKPVAEPDSQTTFYFEYFGENAPYRVIKCVFDVVKKGHFDSKEAERELFPQEAKLSEAEQVAATVKNTHFFFSEDEELKALIEKIPLLFKSESEIDFATITLLIKGLSSSYRLLELPLPSVLLENFEAHALQAVKKLENPSEYASDIGHRSNDLLPIYIETLKKICREEVKRRKNEKLAQAVNDGTSRDLKEQVLESTEVLETIFTNGLIEQIWSIKDREEQSRLLDITIKAMTLNANHNALIMDELKKAHAFLTSKYNQTKSKMQRLRIYRLLESTGMALPTDAPAVIARDK